MVRRSSELGGNQLVSQNGQGGPSIAQRNRRALKYCHQTLADAQDKWADSLIELMTKHPEGMVRVVALKLYAERVWGALPRQVSVQEQKTVRVILEREEPSLLVNVGTQGLLHQHVDDTLVGEVVDENGDER